MLCKNWVKISESDNDEKKNWVIIDSNDGYNNDIQEVEDLFNDVLDEKNYLVIDKELFARSIMDKENVADLNEMDLITIVNNSFGEFTQDIVELIMEMRCYE